MYVVRHFQISDLFVILLTFIMWGGGGEWSLHIYSNNKLSNFNGSWMDVQKSKVNIFTLDKSSGAVVSHLLFNIL